MPRKSAMITYEIPKRKGSGGTTIHGELKQGELITDNTANKWKLGKAIGIGGFGEIYEVVNYSSSKEISPGFKYVAKIEKHTNGPLFVEINCYLRLGRLEMIEQWKKEKQLGFLGLPYFVASGSHISKGDKYRFLILPKYDRDLEAIFQNKQIFNLKTVLVIASRIIDTLEYIHSHGYVHSDIKASNIMLGHTNNQTGSTLKRKSSRTRSSVKRFAGVALKRSRPVPKTCGHNLRPVANLNYCDDIPYLDYVLNEYEKKKYNGQNKIELKRSLSDEPTENESVENIFEGDEVYLLDYGLATKFLLSNGEHREFSLDQRRAHAGTVLFCSRDAHNGVPSRRSDLESLAYNMIYWLTGTLPWSDDVSEPELVAKKKNRCFTDVKSFLQICFDDCPTFMIEMFNYLNKLQFQDTPNYNFFRILFKKTIKDYGYKDDAKLDFDNLEGWGRKQKKTGRVKSNRKENKTICRGPSLLLYSPLKPLSSNIIFKRPKLRKKIKDRLAKNSMMNWSKILIMDPETIIKQATHRKVTEDDKSFSITESALESLNPTPAMREVFNRAFEMKEERSPYGSRGDELCSVDTVDGYTSEMMRIHKRMIEQRELEFELAMQQSITRKKRGRKRVKRSESPLRPATRSCRTEVTASHHALKKVKSIPLKRSYSLRG